MRKLAVGLAASTLIGLAFGCTSLVGGADRSGGAGGAFHAQPGGTGSTVGSATGSGGATNDAINGEAPPSSSVGQGGTTAAACGLNGGSGAQNIVTVPDPTRSMDSAVYARAALRAHLTPDPSVLRLNDFLNFYGSPRAYVGASALGEIEYLYPEGVIEARFPIEPSSAHTQRSFVILVDTSLSMVPGFAVERAAVKAIAGQLDSTQGDELRVLGWSAGVEPIYDGSPTVDLDAALDAAFAKPGPSSDLSQALTKTLGFADSTASAEKHVLVLTDGGATTEGTSSVLSSFESDHVHLDVALVVLASRLPDAKTPQRAVPYNQSLLTTLTSGDGARLLVSDIPAPDGSTDVDTLLSNRFEEVFGTALPTPRATFTIPAFLKFVGSGLGTSDTGTLAARGVGFDRTLTLRLRVQDVSMSDPTTLSSDCADQTIAARISGMPTLLGTVLSPTTNLGRARRAISAYVAALRDPTGANFAAANDAITQAKAHVCPQSPSDILCTTMGEIGDLLAQHPLHP